MRRRSLLAIPLASAGCMPQPVPAVVALDITADGILATAFQQGAFRELAASWRIREDDLLALLQASPESGV